MKVLALILGLFYARLIRSVSLDGTEVVPGGQLGGLVAAGMAPSIADQKKL